MHGHAGHLVQDIAHLIQTVELLFGVRAKIATADKQVSIQLLAFDQLLNKVERGDGVGNHLAEQLGRDAFDRPPTTNF